MNSKATDANGAASEAHADYTTEINALHQWLGADKSELGQLLDPIRRAKVAPQPAYALLKQAWLTLQDLRDRQSEFAGLADLDADTASLVEQAFRQLQTGETFSLDAAEAAFEQAARRFRDGDQAARDAAALIAAQAQIAAARLDHYRAAELCANAAAVEGLDTPLQWRYQLKRAAALAEQGRAFVDTAALEEACSHFENQVLPLAPREERPADWAETQHHWGEALGMLGLQQRGTRSLEQAISHLKEALSERTREAMAAEWAATQNSLGHVMGALAQRNAEGAMLEKAVEAFEAALEVRSLEESPQDWAITQNNLGAALLTLGHRNKDTGLLERSTDAFGKVLQVWTRERAPLDWAMTQNNLATALRTLGEHREDPGLLEGSVTACRDALSERARERVPLDWAMTQNNLGAALHRLGQHQENPQHLEAAMEAYDNAVKEWTRERGPVTWAMTLANKAAARKVLAELTADVELVHQSMSDFLTIGEVFRHASHAQYYELTVEQIALLQKLEQQILAGKEA